MKISTAQEAINGNSNDTVITPLRLKQVLSSMDLSGGGGGFIESETDPIFNSSPAAGITTSNIASWNNKQNALVSGQNIKTINGQDILGEGNITIESGGISEESDPTVPQHVKNITQEDINKWNSSSGVSFDMIYPIGSIYISASATVNPNVVFTGTQWERFAKGRTLVGVNEGDTNFATVGLEGGSYTHKHGLTSGYAHINSSGKTIIYQYKRGTAWKANYQVIGNSGSSSSMSYSDVTTLGGTTDNGNNMPPFITVFMWKRVA